MRLFHGSNTPDIKILTPRLADHGRPLLYLTTLQFVAGFYLINAAQRPCYWFPYGFEADGTPHYQEWYPDALKDAAAGKKGCIYSVNAEEGDVSPLQGIPCAVTAEKAMRVTDCLLIPDCYAWLMERQRQGAFVLRRYEEKTQEQRNAMRQYLVKSLLEEGCGADAPGHPYAAFVKEKFPEAWADYIKMNP